MRWADRWVFVHHPSGSGEAVLLARAWVGSRSRRLKCVEVVPLDPAVSQVPRRYSVAYVTAPASARYAAAGLSAELVLGERLP